MSLDFRYFVAFSGGLVVISLAMMAISRIDDFLVYALIFNIPFASIEKWLFLQPVAVAARGINIGLSELLIFIAYTVWFIKIVIVKSEPLPKLRKPDYCIIFLLLVQMISLLGAPNKVLGIFDIVFNIKHILIYFFILHKVKREHLKYIIILFLFTIFFESGLAFYERFSGNVSIGLAKGDTQSEDFGTQYEVPGLEQARAAGTTQDSHTLALYYTMLLPVPLVLMCLGIYRTSTRFALMGVFLIGTAGLLATYSRSGWFSFAISMFVAVMIISFVWKRYLIIPVVLAIVAAVVISSLGIIADLYERIFNAPHGIMEARYETYRTALDIWRQNPLFGYGPGNYIDALDDPRILQQTVKGVTGSNVYDIPVHNSYLWVASELGTFGLIAFFSIPILIVTRCLACLKSEDVLLRGFSLAVLTAVIGYLLDGITGPMFRDTVPYTQLWVYAAIIFSGSSWKRVGKFTPIVSVRS